VKKDITMVYKFDPKYWNDTIFLLGEYHMSAGWIEYCWENKPIPASYFPKSLTVVNASQELPDMFHTSRDLIVFSERARVFVEKWAPGQVEFIPVAVSSEKKIAGVLQLDSAYYFINVLARAQRFLWLDMPVNPFPIGEDGIRRFGSMQDYRQWKFRQRAPEEPLIWQESWWRVGDKEYRGHTNILVEDSLWRELDTTFPNQLNALKADQ
jgi:hypothetical protein